MGAWGPDSFDNDIAADWAATFAEADDFSLIDDTFDEALDTEDETLDADIACEALAACEVLARLRGKFGARSSYSETLDAWVENNPRKPGAALLKRADRVIARVLGEESELRELWDDAGSEEWVKAVQNLRMRLTT
jgi:hypothetical protein